MAKRRITPGFTKQGVRDLSYIKAPPRKRLELPPFMGSQCDHPHGSIREDHVSGATMCRQCGNCWDYSGNPI